MTAETLIVALLMTIATAAAGVWVYGLAAMWESHRAGMPSAKPAMRTFIAFAAWVASGLTVVELTMP